MYGYIYKTENILTGEIYIGQKKSKKFIKNYYGSGKLIQQQLNLFPEKYFKVTMLHKLYDKKALDEYEKFYIEKYKMEYGYLCLNIAEGGMGSNTFKYMTDKEKQKFVEKMTQINRERCSSEEFKRRASIRMVERHRDPDEVRRHSEKIRKAWSDSELLKQQSERIKKWHEGIDDYSYLCHPCAFKQGDRYIEFKSIKDLRQFLIDEFDYNPDRKTFMRLLKDGSEGKEYMPYHKNKEKLMKMKGMLIFKL